MKQKISVADLSDGRSIEFWHSWLEDELCPYMVTDYQPGSFYADCEMASAGDLRFVRFKGSKQTFERPQSIIKSSQSDFYMFSILHRGTGAVDHNGNNQRYGSGDALLIDSTRPQILVLDQDVEFTNVFIPRSKLDAELSASGVAAGTVLSSRNPSTGLIKTFIERLFQTIDDLEPENASRLASITVDLIAAGFEDQLARGDYHHRQGVLLARAQAFIERQLADPKLSPPQVAAFLGVSLRQVHEIFAADTLTVSDHIWECRLLRAARLIRHDVGHHLSISTIAYRVGFSSPAHFARRFKERFRMTASDFRHSASDAVS